MRQVLAAVLAIVTPLLLGAAPSAKTPPDVELWRLDCGSIWVADLDEYSDTRAYVGQSRRFTASCYLVRHGGEYLLWDTGLPKTELGKRLEEGPVEGATLAATIVEQLARIGIRPQQVSRVGISHYHFDHVGQAADFPGATLLIGKADAELLRTRGGERARPLAPWIGGAGKLQEVEGDKDVFGDGSVVMLDLPGHTPGHHGLLVTLPKSGAVLLSGDVAHFRENLDTGGVPGFNADRARSLASMDRIRALARNLKARLIIQHDERDVPRLPAFPQSER